MTTNILLPRGIRNNNPGNIRLSRVRFQGQREIQNDPDFAEFTDAVWGLRALMKVLITYRVKYGLDTVESIINRYAPPHENATDHYIHHAAKRLGVGRRDPVDVTKKDTLVRLSEAIVRHENGKPPIDRPADWYDDSDYTTAADRALSYLTT
jgi:hypothetical protein